MAPATATRMAQTKRTKPKEADRVKAQNRAMAGRGEPAVWQYQRGSGAGPCFGSACGHGTMLAVGSNYEVRIYDVTGSAPHLLNTLNDFVDEHPKPVWIPDGSRLAVATYADVEVWGQPWDPAAASKELTYQYYADRTPPEPSVSVDTVAWSPDGAYAASNLGVSIDIWDTTTGSRVRRIMEDYWSRTTQLIWTEDNRLFMSNVNGAVILLDPNTGAEVSLFGPNIGKLPTVGVWSMALSPDGSKLVSGSDDGTIAVWGDTRTTEFLTQTKDWYIQISEQDIVSLDWDARGQFIAAGVRDGTIRILDAGTGEQLEMIQVGEGVLSVAFRPGSFELAYGEADGTVRIVVPASIQNKVPTADAGPDQIITGSAGD